MTFQRSCKNRGIILVDILLAFSLSVVFVAVISETSYQARDIFDRAFLREGLLRVFESSGDTGLFPGQSREISVGDITMQEKAIWFGNDRIETDTDLSFASTSWPKNGGPRISFQAVRAYPYANMNDTAGTPLCSVNFSKNSSRIIIKPITLPIDPLLPLTDIEVRGKFAYVSADSNTANDPDLFVFDISDHNSAYIKSSINTGPGIAAIAIAGNYIYAAAASTAAQLHILNAISPSNLVLEKKYQIPLPQASTSPAFGSAIFYNRGRIYLGTEKWDGAELSVVDVAVPSRPNLIGSLEIGSKVNSIFVRNNIAYLASSDINQLDLIDVGDPARMKLSSVFSPSGWQRQESKVINYFEDGMVFGRTSGGFDIVQDPELFAWPKEASSTLISPNFINIPGGVYGIVSDRDHIYSATREINRELRVSGMNVSASSTTYYSLPVAPQAMTCDGNKLYILAHLAPVIYEINYE